ncbi:hypothetical protein Vretimale_6761 [Volvox reticuliferus]|uniref:Uncharacterized protein n=1 Tax=Volvox reticuliferus TaxID=1737510 RepID=A0A8J4G817_9CHLO|nr:hypothetical protein Vretifemale_7119 [Volvox reticuliferus]GIM02007.1 hypothetical protein Vretimale_6761 [Volvox reticuliferus]
MDIMDSEQLRGALTRDIFTKRPFALHNSPSLGSPVSRTSSRTGTAWSSSQKGDAASSFQKSTSAPQVTLSPLPPLSRPSPSKGASIIAVASARCLSLPRTGTPTLPTLTPRPVRHLESFSKLGL